MIGPLLSSYSLSDSAAQPEAGFRVDAAPDEEADSDHQRHRQPERHVGEPAEDEGDVDEPVEHQHVDPDDVLCSPRHALHQDGHEAATDECERQNTQRDPSVAEVSPQVDCDDGRRGELEDEIADSVGVEAGARMPLPV